MNWLSRWVDPDWRKAHKMLSMQIAFFWIVVSGLWVALPAFQAFLDPISFAVLCIVFAGLIMVGRLTNQPGV